MRASPAATKPTRRHSVQFPWQRIGFCGCRSPSKKYARRTIGSHTRNAIQMEDKRQGPGYHGNSLLSNGGVMHSNDNYLHSNSNHNHHHGSGNLSSPVHHITRGSNSLATTTNSLLPRTNTSPVRQLPGRTQPQGALLSNSTSYPSSLTTNSAQYRQSGYNSFNHNSVTRATLPPDYKHSSDLNKNTTKSWSDGKLPEDE